MCLGKTFAETVAKSAIAMMLKFYKLEHADPQMKKTTFNFDIFQLKTPKIEYTFTKRSPNQNKK